MPWLPQTLFGGMSFIAGILIFLLPETGKNVSDNDKSTKWISVDNSAVTEKVADATHGFTHIYELCKMMYVYSVPPIQTQQNGYLLITTRI